MKAWAEMTERERDVLVCQTLGYIPVQTNWWLEPARRFNCDPNDKFIEWVREVSDVERENKRFGVEYEGRDERFKGKRFVSPGIRYRFSTDRAAAMSLLDGVEQFDIKRRVLDDGTMRYWCRVSKTDKEPWFDDFDCGYAYGVALSNISIEDVICKAWLRAQGVDVK